MAYFVLNNGQNFYLNRTNGVFYIKTVVTPTPTPTPTSTSTPTPTPTPTQVLFAAGVNSANYNLAADWDGFDGNFTTVGSNGGPSAYGTYDQSGQIFQSFNIPGASQLQRRGGSYANTSASSLSSSFRSAAGSTNSGGAVSGFRIASSNNPLSLNYFVTVSDAGNAADSNGYGAVSYAFQMGQYLVTNCEYIAFLNAVAATDTYSVYIGGMSGNRGGVTRSGSSGSYTYSVKSSNYANKPIIWIDWFKCARYCNWLHNGKPSGAQNSGTTEDGAYTLNGAVSGNALAKNANASYWLPLEDEWYKAAFYKGGSLNAGYWLYATQSNTAPTAVNALSNGTGTLDGSSAANVTGYSCA